MLIAAIHSSLKSFLARALPHVHLYHRPDAQPVKRCCSVLRFYGDVLWFIVITDRGAQSAYSNSVKTKFLIALENKTMGVIWD